MQQAYTGRILPVAQELSLSFISKDIGMRSAHITTLQWTACLLPLHNPMFFLLFLLQNTTNAFNIFKWSAKSISLNSH